MKKKMLSNGTIHSEFCTKSVICCICKNRSITFLEDVYNLNHNIFPLYPFMFLERIANYKVGKKPNPSDTKKIINDA